jgi:hypothetical protein
VGAPGHFEERLSLAQVTRQMSLSVSQARNLTALCTALTISFRDWSAEGVCLGFPPAVFRVILNMLPRKGE